MSYIRRLRHNGIGDYVVYQNKRGTKVVFAGRWAIFGAIFVAFIAIAIGAYRLLF